MEADLEARTHRRERIPHALKRGKIPQIMGILNVTEDSFYAGSRVTHDEAIARGLAMWRDGATWIDIGGESTRPGAQPVSEQEELERVIPVIKALRAASPMGLISIDTRHASVAAASIAAGVDLVNDITGLRNQSMYDVVLNTGCAVCIMHMQGEPANMQHNPTYSDCVNEVRISLDNVRARLIEDGHPAELICIDPGIGFGKSPSDNIELLRAGRHLSMHEDCKILWGVSRKSIIGHITGQQDPNERLAGTLGIATAAYHFGIDILRVHDVREHLDVLTTLHTLTTNEIHQAK